MLKLTCAIALSIICVTANADVNKSIDYNAIVALLVSKVKSLEAQIKDIQDKVK